MKIRKGFVSNSSTSSFVCDVCGTVESDMDLCLSDVDMFECKIGHTICEHHISNDMNSIMSKMTIAELKEFIKFANDEFDILPNTSMKDFLKLMSSGEIDDIFDWEELTSCLRYDVPCSFCPICNLTRIPDDVMAAYISKILGKTQKEIESDIRSRFRNLKELRAFTNPGEKI